MAQPDFVSRGQDLVLAGQYQEAVKVCRLGLLARPTDVGGRLVLGQALLALRRYDEVLAEMRVAVELDTNNAGAHQLKGEALLRKGDAFAAVDALEHARQLAPTDPAIAGLLAESRLAIAADGARSTGPAMGDYGDSLTKHYPAHRGGDAAGTGASSSLTRPITGGARAGRTPPPEELAVGDRSGTVELADVDLEEDEDDEVAEPPLAGGSRRGVAVAEPGQVTSTTTMAVDDDDLVELDEVDEDETTLGAHGGDHTAAQRPPRRAADASGAAAGRAGLGAAAGGQPVPRRERWAPTRSPRVRPTPARARRSCRCCVGAAAHRRAADGGARRRGTSGVARQPVARRRRRRSRHPAPSTRCSPTRWPARPSRPLPSSRRWRPGRWPSRRRRAHRPGCRPCRRAEPPAVAGSVMPLRRPRRRRRPWCRCRWRRWSTPSPCRCGRSRSCRRRCPSSTRRCGSRGRPRSCRRRRRPAGDETGSILVAPPGSVAPPDGGRRKV
ncbi:MAG: hypothetical protein HS111_02135 [Kofleriaceae bacterium]|nr:hypothetical protein [Kofleriaceae bacterium]